jgi:hypothetical protein
MYGTKIQQMKLVFKHKIANLTPTPLQRRGNWKGQLLEPKTIIEFKVREIVIYPPIQTYPMEPF